MSTFDKRIRSSDIRFNLTKEFPFFLAYVPLDKFDLRYEFAPFHQSHCAASFFYSRTLGKLGNLIRIYIYLSVILRLLTFIKILQKYKMKKIWYNRILTSIIRIFYYLKVLLWTSVSYWYLYNLVYIFLYSNESSSCNLILKVIIYGIIVIIKKWKYLILTIERKYEVIKMLRM